MFCKGFTAKYNCWVILEELPHIQFILSVIYSFFFVSLRDIVKNNGLTWLLNKKNSHSLQRNFTYCSFIAEDLLGDEQYVISMNISVCLESAGPCEVALVIFDNDRLPKPTCDWNTDFIIPGKPLSVYLESSVSC